MTQVAYFEEIGISLNKHSSNSDTSQLNSLNNHRALENWGFDNQNFIVAEICNLVHIDEAV